MNKSLMTVPRATPGASPLEFDLTEVNRGLARELEVAAVTAFKAPELLSTFNRAHAQACEIAIQLQREVAAAKSATDRIRAVIILDRAPEVLRTKGLSSTKNPAGSEDLRQAVVDADPEYRTAVDQLDQLKAFYEFVKSKAKSLENSYMSVRRLLGEDLMAGRSPNTSAGNEGDASIGDVVTSDGFGEPRI